MRRTTADGEPSNGVEALARRIVARPQSVYRVLFYVATGFFLLLSLYPLYWLLVLSLSSGAGLDGPLALPDGVDAGAYLAVFRSLRIHRYVLNSLVVATLTTAIVLAVGTLAGYVFGRYEFPGRTPLLLSTLAISYFPPTSFVIPLFRLFTANVAPFGLAVDYPQLYNTPGAVVLPLSALTMPLAIFVLATFYGQIPDGLEDAARISGSTRIGALVRVIVPLSAPGVAAAGVLTFIVVYNEFFFSSLMLEGDPEEWSVLLHGLFRAGGPSRMAAASLVGVVPMAVLVALAQNSFVAGLTEGGVDG